MSEAPEHPHNVARETFVTHEGVVQPAPAPRFSETPSSIRNGPPTHGADTDDALAAWGIEPDEVARLRSAGIVGPR